uniref:Uncharacterized protein n=1 Tax=Opuntia streptacantha TaxID=393608 RepID=A0A7C9A817_OPUST
MCIKNDSGTSIRGLLSRFSTVSLGHLGDMSDGIFFIKFPVSDTVTKSSLQSSSFGTSAIPTLDFSMMPHRVFCIMQSAIASINLCQDESPSSQSSSKHESTSLLMIVRAFLNRCSLLSISSNNPSSIQCPTNQFLPTNACCSFNK